MIPWTTLKELATGYRRVIRGALDPEVARAGTIPPTWRNHLHWHAGHLVTAPHLLTLGLAGEPLGIPDEYRKWFAKGTSPAEWNDDPVPEFERLLPELEACIPRLYEEFTGREDVPYARPYQTSVGVTLHTPAEAFAFLVGHDGIHLGLILALKRGLDALEG